MGALDSIAEFYLNGEIFEAEEPQFKEIPKLTNKEVKIVVSEPAESEFVHRCVWYGYTNNKMGWGCFNEPTQG